MNASSCGAPDTVLDLFGPETDTSKGPFLIENDDASLAPCTLEGNAFPQIDGSETFAAFDLQGVFMDGRSFSEAAAGQQTLQRTSCGVAAPLVSSWNIAVTSTAGVTPGPLSTGQNRICVSEVAAATNKNFEFIEVFVE